jgi:hypothetical protein
MVYRTHKATSVVWSLGFLVFEYKKDLHAFSRAWRWRFGVELDWIAIGIHIMRCARDGDWIFDSWMVLRFRILFGDIEVL